MEVRENDVMVRLLHRNTHHCQARVFDLLDLHLRAGHSHGVKREEEQHARLC